jgi:hypothetical protein
VSILASPDQCPQCGRALRFDMRVRGPWRCPAHGPVHDAPPTTGESADLLELARSLVDADPDFKAMLPKQQDRYVADVRRLAAGVLACALGDA